MSAFVRDLKVALVADVRAHFVFAANIEVERQWALGEVGLPRLSSSMAVVNRMDELALLLAGPDDAVLLKAAPDEQYLDYLTGLGFDLPQVVAIGN
jgi:pre ATP-grasp domain-containing protein